MTRSYRRFKPMEHVVGTDQAIVISLKDTSGGDLGVSGASAVYKVYRARPRRRRQPFVGNAVFEASTTIGNLALATGQATITIADSDLVNRSGHHWHELKVTDASGNISHLGQGEIFLRRQLT